MATRINVNVSKREDIRVDGVIYSVAPAQDVIPELRDFETTDYVVSTMGSIFRTLKNGEHREVKPRAKLTATHIPYYVTVNGEKIYIRMPFGVSYDFVIVGDKFANSAVRQTESRLPSVLVIVGGKILKKIDNVTDTELVMSDPDVIQEINRNLANKDFSLKLMVVTNEYEYKPRLSMQLTSSK